MMNEVSRGIAVFVIVCWMFIGICCLLDISREVRAVRVAIEKSAPKAERP